MMAASDALIALGSPESLDGLVSWARRKFGPIAATVAAQGGPAPAPSPSPSPPPAAAPAPEPASAPASAPRGPAWAPWLDGIRLHARGKSEAAASELRALLTPSTCQSAAPSTCQLDAAAASFAAVHVSECYADVADWDALST